MEYKLKPLDITLEKGEDLASKIPLMKDREIEKRGHVITFTVSQVEKNNEMNLKNKKEIEAKKNYEEAIVANIERNHKFVKKLTREQCLTVWMYQEAKGIVELCDEKLAELNKQIEDDAAEMEEIYKQIPDLKAPIVQEAENIINEDGVVPEQPSEESQNG